MEDNFSNSRVVAFHISSNDNLDVLSCNIASIQMMGICNDWYVFAPSNVTKLDGIDSSRWLEFPDDASTSPKQKNFIIDWCKMRYFDGFLHMVEHNIKFNAMTKSYMDKLESTMSTLDYDIHFSTTTDRCNFVFNKFCPRLTLDIDDDIIKQKLSLPDKISFTSHSNVSYITYNFGAINNCPPKFDERFTIGMFYIIEFLARRRATRKDGQLYYMNQYLSISDEVGGYDIVSQQHSDVDNEEAMKKENELFRSLVIDYAPDNNIDIVLDAFYNKLKSKLA